MLPLRYTFSGRVRIPAGTSKSKVCDGTVTLTLRRGATRVARVRARVSKACTYRARVTIRTRLRTGRRAGTLRVTAAFGGSPSLKASSQRGSVRFF